MDLQEVGVSYSNEPRDTLIAFEYVRIFLEDDMRAIDTVYCLSAADFYKLLDHWNKDPRWKFRSTP